jgi:type I restriction enzyme M protein
VQLIDATRHFQKMKKSLGNKRNELSEEHIREITRLYADGRHNATSRFRSNGEEIERVCSKVFDNRDFGYLKLTIERPLRLNFQASPERIARLKDQTAFANLAESKKRKDKGAIAVEEAAGRELQDEIIGAIGFLNPERLYKNRDEFRAHLDMALKNAGLKASDPRQLCT